MYAHPEKSGVRRGPEAAGNLKEEPRRLWGSGGLTNAKQEEGPTEGVLKRERVQESKGVKILELWRIKRTKVPVLLTIFIRPLILLVHLHLHLYGGVDVTTTRSRSRPS